MRSAAPSGNALGLVIRQQLGRFFPGAFIHVLPACADPLLKTRAAEKTGWSHIAHMIKRMVMGAGNCHRAPPDR